MRQLVGPAIVAMFLVDVSPASACWDGWAATVGNVTVRQAGDSEWRAETARVLATWLPRMDALLPSGTRLESDQGYVSLWSSTGGEAIAQARWNDGKLTTLFDTSYASFQARGHGRGSIGRSRR